MLPVSNFLVALSVSVCAVVSLLVTVTLAPAFTVSVPEYANPEMVIPFAALPLMDDGPGADDELPPPPEELHAVSIRTVVSAAAARVRNLFMSAPTRCRCLGFIRRSGRSADVGPCSLTAPGARVHTAT